MTIEHLALLIIGLLAGLFGGLLGVGGSVIMIPAMHLLIGPNQHLYQAAGMIVNFFVVLPAVIQHRKAEAMLTPIVRVTIPVAAISVIAGVWLSSGTWFKGANEVYLARLFGGFLFYLVAYNVYRLAARNRLPDIDQTAAGNIARWRIACYVGVPAGLMGGLLGIGGGAIAVPAQQVFLKIPLRRAIANSAATILLISLIGATYKNYANVRAGIPLMASLRLALFLIPTAVIGGHLGSRLTHTLPREIIRGLLILLLCYGGYSMLTRSAKPAATVPPSTGVSVTVIQNMDEIPIL